MVNSILIGKTIYKLLSENVTLKQMVGDKIYPLVAENDVTYPFIVYFRTSISNRVNKDGYYEDEVGFAIIVVSNTYISSLEIANEVRKTLDKRKLSEEISNVILEDVDEDFINDAFVQQLYFKCAMN